MIGSIAKFFIKKRFRSYEWAKNHPLESQQMVFRDLIRQLKKTRYGRLYQAEKIKSYLDFARLVPLVFYEDLTEWIEQARQSKPNVLWPGKVKWFAKSSGTTNDKSKFIPITNDSLYSCHYKAGKDLMAVYIHNHPDTKIFTKKILRLGGSCQLYKNFGTTFGDLSSILIKNLPKWIDWQNVPNQEISLMHEWEAKMEAITRAVVKKDVASMAGVPSWMLILLQRIKEKTGVQKLSQIWPNMEVFFHGGIHFEPYQKPYEELFEQKLRYYEIYNASEGFFAFQDEDQNKDLLLLTHHGIFYEFISMDTFHSDQPEVIPLDAVEPEKNYALVISTNGGLWRYIIGDTVKFTSLDPYRIRITGRTKHYINAFGEEMVIENAQEAIKAACTATDAVVDEFTAAPKFISENEKGCHEWVISFVKPPQNLEKFSYVLDDTLKKLNSDYEAKRYKDMTMKFPIIHATSPQLFLEWMKKRGKLGGQNKVPRLSNDRKYLDELLELKKVMRL